MHDAVAPKPPMDPETLDFLHAVLDAVRRGEAARLAPLLDKGLPPNLRDHKGDSLLMLAAYHGHFDTAEALLRHGADPELANDRGQTPLAGAAFKGDLRMARLLLDHGARVDGTGPDGRTPLMVAAMFNRLDILELLLARGADPAARDAAGMTAWEAALKMGAVEAAQRLGQTPSSQ
ncbi:ankyrin repeat domain-containing protein [Azohydromonas caseinilytica]|uniref:Ankyrin repeat domain-containing protein n=1 Tax=Azohydromonas caseinilytica TaxID=2728836 RepID=A0A848F5U2_9BURK|nr:ankyrin repeat domain-containing protein [Azohydromonas caseinilytica]NML15437.1 ankyrin repeat domain-containing protein [Azohydromonas caseinilytica]